MSNVSNSDQARKRLANRRSAETFDLEVNGLRYTCTIGQFASGQIGEIFLQNHKPGSQSDANARDSAIAASLALQFGCPIDVLQRALLRDPRGNPATPLGAAIDLIAGTTRVQHEPDGGWLVLTHRGHGWLHGGFHDALGNAREIAAGYGVTVRSTAEFQA
jgi:hypothetical protein